MFFGLTFQFKIILEEFDAHDGLRKLHNVVSQFASNFYHLINVFQEKYVIFFLMQIATLSILLPDAGDANQLNEDQECAARQIVRHVCVAYRRYLEAHLNSKAEPIRRSQIRPNQALPAQLSYKACKSSPEEIQQQVETLLQNMPLRGHWGPVDQLLKLGGITLLLKIIAFAYEWNYR